MAKASVLVGRERCAEVSENPRTQYRFYAVKRESCQASLAISAVAFHAMHKAISMRHTRA
jgi:hypothetical protein